MIPTEWAESDRRRAMPGAATTELRTRSSAIGEGDGVGEAATGWPRG